MRAMAEDGNKKAALVLKLIENPSQMLSSILVGNNLVNISLTSLTTTIAIRIFGSMGAGIATAVITILVLVRLYIRQNRKPDNETGSFHLPHQLLPVQTKAIHTWQPTPPLQSF